ncbi:MAG TPA: citramalate synthase [Nitrospirae bacterium]|nr:2-isopropylmalate synthase [bacterium BMS3Abin10]GBE38826.1 2-isopropylmalate synthase [bacterium BMS3Bbin08]HDH50512.1 citramalate synthase [Nitrospirota bacterium]HDK41236.1 citramalate synthase [Nitrospirota bacterium]HDK81087.1 citramalate synthase [Nitrospirota bacterium]
MRSIEIYDTTLRDGAQSEDISFSVEDKLRITGKLDELGIHYIEGGWPGSNPRDAEFFKLIKKLRLKTSEIAAFGATHRASVKVNKDPSIKALLAAKTPVITIVGKTWDFHAREALRVSLKTNLDLIYNTIVYLKKRVPKVFFDAEHFFDGYMANPEYAVKALETAVDAGTDCLVLCDSNGGTLPQDLGDIVKIVIEKFKTPIGIHAHNDAECAVANSMIAARLGASQVQGTINGLGERCGNANLISVIANLKIKLKYNCITAGKLKKLKEVSRFVTEISNLRHFKRQPFVGDSAFAHKGGIHVSAIQRRSETYEHIKPELVGNYQRVLISDLSGKSNILRKAKEFRLKIDHDSPKVAEIIRELKDLENQGFQFEGAEASFELLMKKAFGLHRTFFDLIGFRVIDEKRQEKEKPLSEATIMVKVRGKMEHTAATGNGPVNAIDNALRRALEKFYPQLKQVKLIDYKVRVLAAGKGTSAKVRVLIESGDNTHKWGTVGVSDNIIEASWQALVDSIEYKLLRG